MIWRVSIRRLQSEIDAVWGMGIGRIEPSRFSLDERGRRLERIRREYALDQIGKLLCRVLATEVLTCPKCGTKGMRRVAFINQPTLWLTRLRVAEVSF